MQKRTAIINDRQQKLFCVTEVGTELGISTSTLKTWATNGTIEPPSHVLCARKYYCEDDLPAIAKVKKEYDSLLSVAQVAAMSDTPRINIDWHVRTGSIPAPTTPKGPYFYYTEAEAGQIIEYFDTRRRLKAGDYFHWVTGCREVGLTKTEAYYALSQHCQPPADVVHGCSIRNRYWHRNTLEAYKMKIRS